MARKTKGRINIKKGMLLLGLIILGLALVLSGCGSKQATPTGGGQAADENKEPVIVRLEGGDWGFPQPFTHYSRGPGMSKMWFIFDSMLEKDEQGYIPWLAESWDIKDGGKTFIFHIRPGVKWHDGQELTAADVAFSIEYFQQFPPVSIFQMAFDPDFLQEINVIDTHTLELRVAEPRATFLEQVGSVRIIPQHIWAQVTEPEKFTGPEAVIGTGPLMLIDYSKEHGTYRYQKNPNFWGPEPALDYLEFIPVSDPLLALEKGEIHAATIPADLVARFSADPNFGLMEKPAFWGFRLRFNFERIEEFNNEEVRQAFAYAIDRQDLVDKFARGAAIPASMGILSPHHRWANPNVPQYQHNPEKARELLAGAQVTTPLQLELLVGGGREVRLGEILKEQLAQVGIELTVVSADGRARDARIAEGNYQLVLVGHGGWGSDPDFLRTRFAQAGGNWFSGTPGYSNPLVNNLAQAQMVEMNEAERKKIIFELQQVLAEDVPEIPLLLTTEQMAYNKQVYSGWRHVFDHHEPSHNKLSYLKR